jgi:monofunctional biosynthetic peptidoglycan transglycosylase
MPASTFHRELPALETVTPPTPPDDRQSPSEPLSPDDAFSAVAVEASSLSRTSVETAIAQVIAEIKPHPPIEIQEVVLPVPTAAPGADLGDTIPQRMFEPRFAPSQPQTEFEKLRVDPPIRQEPPAMAPIETAQPLARRDYGALFRRGLKLLAWIALGWLALVLALIIAYRFVNPPASTLMLQHWLTGQAVEQEWVPFNEISPNVVRAVLLSEDGRFCEHSGVDLEAIEQAIENTDGRARGGSTISMQVVKNLFLWPSKSYLRKAIELPLTYFAELVWSKRRIMEIYLNIAEWGPGVFGIGAAASYHFGKSAGSLSARDAARLAASLPNPLERNAGHPRPGLQRLARAIEVRMRLAPSSQLACVLPRRLY